MSRVPIEKVEEVIRNAVHQVVGDDSVITISSDLSYADDSNTWLEVSTGSGVFDTTDSDIGDVSDKSAISDKSAVTGSISDDKDATVFNFDKVHVRQAKKALNVSGKRFERQTGAKCGKNFDVEFRPVSHRSYKSMSHNSNL